MALETVTPSYEAQVAGLYLALNPLHMLSNVVVLCGTMWPVVSRLLAMSCAENPPRTIPGRTILLLFKTMVQQTEQKLHKMTSSSNLR